MYIRNSNSGMDAAEKEDSGNSVDQPHSLYIREDCFKECCKFQRKVIFFETIMLCLCESVILCIL